MKSYLRWKLRIAGIRIMDATAPTAALRFLCILRTPKKAKMPPFWACVGHAWYSTLADRAWIREQQARKANMKWLDAGHKYTQRVYQ